MKGKVFITLMMLFPSLAWTQNRTYGTFPSGSYAEFYNYKAVSELKSGSICFWFKINDLSNPVFFFSVSNKLASARSNEIVIKYIPELGSIQNVCIQSGAIVMNAYIPDRSIKDNEWHHYAVISDGEGAIEVYLDGVVQVLSHRTNDYFLGDVSGINNMKIGKLERDLTYASTDFDMDEFGIWNNALSADEVKSFMNGSTVPSASTLMVYYSFDRVEDLEIGNKGSNDIRDLSDNNIHADFIQPMNTAAKVDEQIEEVEVQYTGAGRTMVHIQLTIPAKGTGLLTGHLINASGMTMMSWQEMVSRKYDKKLDLSGVPSGSYIIELTTKKFKKRLKAVKK